MRSIDDPRSAAELFCRQHGITDAKTIHLLEETLRELLYPPRSSSSSSLSWPWDQERLPSSQPTSAPPSLSPSPPKPSASPPPPLSSPPLENARGAAARASPSRAGEAHSTEVESKTSALHRPSTAGATSGVEQQHGKLQELPQRPEEDEGRGGEGAEGAAAAAVAAAAEGGASQTPSEGIDVTEVARAMRAAAIASQDSGDAEHVVVDLVVNGNPAPLVFSLPRGRPRFEKDQDHDAHGRPGRDRKEEGTLANGGCAQGGGGARCDGEGTNTNKNDDGRGEKGEQDGVSTYEDDCDESESIRAALSLDGGEGKPGGSGDGEKGNLTRCGARYEKAKGDCAADQRGVDQDHCEQPMTEVGGRTGNDKSQHGREAIPRSDHGREAFQAKTIQEASEWKEEKDREEEKERAIAAAAAAWCREFGSDRIEDTSFVEAEIQKAVAVAEAAVAAREQAAAETAAAETAAAAAAAGEGNVPAPAAAAAAAGTTPVEKKVAPSSTAGTANSKSRKIAASAAYPKGSRATEELPHGEAAIGLESRATPRAEDEERDGGGDEERDGGGKGGEDARRKNDGGLREGDSSSSSSSSSLNSEDSSTDSSRSRNKRRGNSEDGNIGAAQERQGRLTISSVLAPDVECGTSIFWVQVEPRLPAVYVLAGYSALEISEQFCRTHGLGPSQVPLVAWKLLEAYPVQMEAARRDGTPLPAKVTVGYAVRQPEIQVACLLLVAGPLLTLLRARVRGSRWRDRARVTPRRSLRGHLKRQEAGDVTPTGFYAFRGRFFPRWERTKQREEHQREDTKQAAALSSLVTNGNSGRCPVPGSGRPGDLVSPSSLLHRLIGRGVGTAAGEEAARGKGASEKEAAEEKAGRRGQDGSARPSRTRRGELHNENPAGVARNRTTAAIGFAVRKAIATVMHGGRNSSGGNGKCSENTGTEGGKTLRGGSLALSRLRSWADALSFECGRIIGTAVRRVVVMPLVRVFSGGGGGGGGRSTDTNPSPAEVIAAYPWPKKRAKPASAAGTRNRQGQKRFSKGLGVDKDGSKLTQKDQKSTSPDCRLNPDAAEVDNTPVRRECQSSGGDEGRAPFSAGRDDQRGSSDGSKEKGEQKDVPEVAVAAATSSIGGNDPPQPTWASVLDGVMRDPLNRFSAVALLSNVGHILAKTDAFAIEAHEACDWTRLFKSKKGDITVGKQKFLVLSRDEGNIIASNKGVGTKMIGCKTRSGTVVLGAYKDHSKADAREGMAWLAETLASARVR